MSHDLSNIEQNISNNNFVIENSETPYDIINKTFFNSLSELINLEDVILIEKTKEKILKNYKENLSSILVIENKVENKVENKKVQLTIEEELIFQSYFNSFNKNDINKILITDYYISEVKKLNISNESMVFCLNTLSFIKNQIIYFNYDAQNNLSYKSLYSSRCWDSCMSDKADSVWKDGNWIDKAAFIATAAETVAWWGGSCAWDCW